jgi:SAM-dependent methyltransferase
MNYSIVTELPGDQITVEAMRMLRTRYALARKLCAGKDVLELACGPALGVVHLAGKARSVIGGDCNLEQLRMVFARTGRRLPLVCLDAHTLPFGKNSFDLVILFEAIYYLTNPGQFLRECRRVMRPDGLLLVSLANRDWPGFNPSPFSTRYFSAVELFELLKTCGFVPEVYGAFPSKPTTASQTVRDHIRRFAVRGGLIPRTLRAKAALKRVFYGALKTVGRDLDDCGVEIDPLVRVLPHQNSALDRILYAAGRPIAANAGLSHSVEHTLLNFGSDAKSS